MDYIADLHIHSKYAGACSEQLVLENLDKAAKTKGIGIIGTGDFTHPLWYRDLKEKLVEAEGRGLYRLKSGSAGTLFMATSEVCVIFGDSATDNVKKIHNLIFAPSLDTVPQINEELARFGAAGGLSSDGRPILKMSNSDLVERLYKIDPSVVVTPAHIWTPWFGVLGTMGFNSFEEAYGDQARRIYALETGLSSDTLMNWRVSKLDKYVPISAGDAHSLAKLGREATVFEMERPSYSEIISQIKEKRFKLNIEFYPEEGKYHFDGHRNCNVSLSPGEAKKYGSICPKCRRKLTIGVQHRVDDMADRPEGYMPKGHIPYVHAIPLREIIAYVTRKGEGTAYVNTLYQKLVQEFGSEFNVLLYADMAKIAKVDAALAKSIENVRAEHVRIIPGYDGVFGIIDILDLMHEEKKRGTQRQMSEF